MGLMDKFRKSGGGFLNNVDGVIVDYQFTDNPDFGGTKGAKPKGDFTSLWCALTVQQDGSETPETTHLFAGSADDFVISEDGHELAPVGDAQLWGDSSFARFYGSLVEHGLEDVDVADGEPFSFGHTIGARVRFVQVKDEAAMERGRKLFKTKQHGKDGVFNAQGQKKGKDGKYYDIRTLEVSEVYSVEDASPKSRTVPAKGKVSPKASAKPKAAAADDVAEFAEQTLLAILGDAKTHTISKTQLNLAITRKLVKDPRREDVRRFLYDDANLDAMAEAGSITYDKADKTQPVGLPE